MSVNLSNRNAPPVSAFGCGFNLLRPAIESTIHSGCEIWPEERSFELRLVTSVELRTKISAPTLRGIARDGMGRGQEMPYRR